jgi:hypothetical protein
MHALNRHGWIMGWTLVTAAAIISLTVPPLALPADDLGLRRFQVPVNPEMTVSQTFAMTADGLHGVEFQPEAAGDAPSGSLTYELVESGSGVVRQGQISVARALSSSPYTVEFEPIDDSKDAMFRFELLSSPSEPARGIAVWATKGDRYRGGALQINGRDRWADLGFKALAPGARSDWERLVSMQSPPPGISARTVILVAFAAYMLMCGFVLRAVSRFRAG